MHSHKGMLSATALTLTTALLGACDRPRRRPLLHRLRPIRSARQPARPLFPARPSGGLIAGFQQTLKHPVS
jgi:hypothetical protein